MLDNEEHPQKASKEKSSTPSGMLIEDKEVHQEKAASLIRFMVDGKRTLDNDLQPKNLQVVLYQRLVC